MSWNFSVTVIRGSFILLNKFKFNHEDDRQQLQHSSVAILGYCGLEDMRGLVTFMLLYQLDHKCDDGIFDRWGDRKYTPLLAV